MAYRNTEQDRAAPLGKLGDYFHAAFASRLLVEDLSSALKTMLMAGPIGNMVANFNLTTPTTLTADFLLRNDKRDFLQVEGAVISRALDGTLSPTANEVTEKARRGDSLFLLQRACGRLLIVTAANGSTLENQLHWLFDLPQESENWVRVADSSAFMGKPIKIPETIVLANLGLVPELS